MTEWIPIQTGGFIAADVIRWREGVYKPRKSSKSKAVRIGNHLVTAEVLKEPDAKGWVRLLVRKCDILSDVQGKTLTRIPVSTEIKRASRTIMRGKPERLLWSDESARAALASKFLGNRELSETGKEI